ncbi:hypothetical protein [Kibdelosporangium aridum]|uniref:Uncharacterized protein n=1 Tax=Kibdelosporangium aridum TaxID=2030 RepID=A0A1W2CK69_KIBAR|nr:hypothetical protein [Kibdelosporangium aridum]SMC85374.1 hypothetical protein SAMN05661093_02179 [Kibdelosporangium aridum]
MNETEELIKAALAKHVERTPHPGPILTALSRRRRRVRPTLIAIIAATAVAAGIAIPIAIQRPEASAPPATQQPMPEEVRGIKMRYTLKPLSGYTERNRTAVTDGSHQLRVWMKENCSSGKHGPECASSMSVAMYTAKHPHFAEITAPKGERVAVNGTEAWLNVDAGQKMAKLSWRPAEPDTVLLLSLFDPAGDTRQRILDLARTVSPDNTAVVQPPLTFRWLPAEFTRTSVSVSGSSPSTADAWIDAETTDPRGGEVTAKIVAEAIDDPRSHNIAVTLPDGRKVQVMASGNSPIPVEQLRKIGDNLATEPAPDKSWIGR